jgi:hypothetical protein
MSVETRQKMAELSLQIKNSEDECSKVESTISSLRRQYDSLVGQTVEEEEMLAGTDWEIKLNGKDTPYLLYINNQNNSIVSSIEKLIGTDNLVWFELGDGIIISFDAETTLSFTEAKQIISCAKKYKFNIIGTGITDRLARLKRETSALEEICHKFKL